MKKNNKPATPSFALRASAGKKRRGFMLFGNREVHSQVSKVLLLLCLTTAAPRKIIPLKINTELPKKGDEIYLVEKAKSIRPYIKRGVVLFVGKVPEFGGEVIEISNPINPGASGSPLVNKRGEVVGVVSFRLIRGRENKTQTFAVSGTRIKRLVDKRDNLWQIIVNWLTEDIKDKD
ncbi:trypsin-like peptidase domain-containing protein [Candidatus Margulisiibacteriota bacterium]